jgi:hypothetical protein
MRILTASMAVVFAACALGRASAEPAGFSDVICPQATEYVLAVGRLHKDDPPQRIYDAAQAAVDAYQRCSKEKLSNAFREAQHYADTRGAGLAVVAARALVALNRTDEARRELLQWRPLAQQVVDWQSETQTTVQPHAGHEGDNAPLVGTGTGTINSDHRPSMYKASAKEIVLAIDEELSKINDLHSPPKP